MAPPNKQSASPASQPAPTGNAEISAEIGALDGDLAKLKIKFDQYFIGIERTAPSDELERIRRGVMALRRSTLRNSALKFRIDTLYQKFKSYEQLWTKTIREIEEGTYRKDVMRLRLQNLRKAKSTVAEAPKAAPSREMPDFGEDELDQALDDALGGFMDDAPSLGGFSAETGVSSSSVQRSMTLRAGQPWGGQPSPTQRAMPSPAGSAFPPQRPDNPFAVPGVPGIQRRSTSAMFPVQPTAPVRQGLSEARIDQIYRDYLSAKRQCNENTSGITREALAKSLNAKAGAGNDVRVIIRNGKAMLSLVKKG